MGTFCEAFRIIKLEAPPIARNRAQKKQFKPKPKPAVRKPKPFAKTEQPKPIPKRKKTKSATDVEKQATKPFNVKLGRRPLS